MGPGGPRRHRRCRPDHRPPRDGHLHEPGGGDPDRLVTTAGDRRATLASVSSRRWHRCHRSGGSLRSRSSLRQAKSEGVDKASESEGLPAGDIPSHWKRPRHHPRRIRVPALPVRSHHADHADDTHTDTLGSHERQEYRQALPIVLRLATTGYAQYMLGQMHETGQGPLRVFVEAHQGYNLAAARGQRDAAAARDARRLHRQAGQCPARRDQGQEIFEHAGRLTQEPQVADP